MRNQLRQSNSLVVPTVWLVFGVLLPCCGVTQWSWCALIEQNLHLLMIGTLLESGHLETVLCMTENRLSLLASHTGKPREEIVKSSAVLQVFEKCSHRHARALENPCTADLPRSLLHPATLTPIKHARSLLEVVWRCKFPAGGNRSLYDVLAVQGGAGARFFLTDQLSPAIGEAVNAAASGTFVDWELDSWSIAPSLEVLYEWHWPKKNNVSLRFDAACGKDEHVFYFGVGEAF
jgi:hypothetical protein